MLLRNSVIKMFNSPIGSFALAGGAQDNALLKGLDNVDATSPARSATRGGRLCVFAERTFLT